MNLLNIILGDPEVNKQTAVLLYSQKIFFIFLFTHYKPLGLLGLLHSFTTVKRAFTHLNLSEIIPNHIY